jgi:excisionase family DNA binding protein
MWPRHCASISDSSLLSDSYTLTIVADDDGPRKRRMGAVDKLLLKVEEAADALSLGRSKTWELIQRNELPTVKIGRSTRVPAAAVRAFADRLAGEATEASLTPVA